MATAGTMPHATLNSGDNLANKLSNSKKWRSTPAHLDRVASDDFQPPLPQQQHQEKLNRRESRLGLRNIFGRPKATKNGDILPPPKLSKAQPDAQSPSIDSQSAPRGAYSSPYSQTVAQMSQPLPTTPDSESLGPNAPPRPHRPALASWDAPPLFKAYPQAVRYSTLPICSKPLDALLKSQEKTNGMADPNRDTEDKSKMKRRHRRNKSGSGVDVDGKKKIYILVTAGYLLEYSSDGPFDRLPDKVLRLNKHSAAFASDSIPGRHWVLQVASAMNSEGTTLPETSRSLFSRLPFRGTPTTEKRHTSNMFLIFESAEEMDEWLATLRRAIEALGGKKSLSETGKPRGDHVVPLRERASQRTLVVRDPEMYNKRSSLAWEHSNRVSVISIMSDTVREQSIDGASATNSVISQDGQQLESLRGSANRLSVVSSGQRTVMTSSASSPACSPTVDTFPTSPEEHSHYTLETGNPESRIRPNASAIIDRRKSLQTMTPFVEIKGGQSGSRPQSTYTPTGDNLPPTSNAAPNFSVPSSRRFSSNRLSTLEPGTASPVPKDSDMATRATFRKAPPTSLRVSRPLSMVADQPSPLPPVPDRPTTSHGRHSRISDADSESSQNTRPSVESTGQESSNQAPAEVTSKPQSHPRFITKQHSPRRQSSLGTLRRNREYHHGQSSSFEPPRIGSLRSHQSKLSDGDRFYKGGAFASLPSRVAKRSSMLPFVPDTALKPDLMMTEPPAPPPTIPLPPVPASTNKALALQNRRSMPQLTDGPPPAPPPTCALPPLPPLPRKISQRLSIVQDVSRS